MNRATPRPSPLSRYGVSCTIFVLLLVFHVWGVTRGWRSGVLPGNEFRQSQTAITALFIQREHNYSLEYPTPVLGKPWSVPFEFPLYQWCVAAFANSTNVTLTESARTVSAICFYLTLPAFWILLRRMKVPDWQRWLVLGFVVCCPLYIFYARAFLIETMALMFSVWFLAGYVLAIENRSWTWLLVANVAGCGAGLVKVTTFIAYLLLAAVWTLTWFWADWRAGGKDRWRNLIRRSAWISGALLVPFATTYGWLLFADATKAKSPTGRALLSKGLHDYNWGTSQTRFAGDVWKQHWSIWNSDLMMFGTLAVGMVVVLIGGRRYWRYILPCLFFFLLVQTMFPILYAWHEYYYVAIAALLMLGIGFGAVGIFETRLKYLGWVAVLGLYSAQIALYFKTHYPQQMFMHHGGSSLVAAIEEFTDPDDVLVIAGEDWASMTPYYSGRRALMLRRNTDHDWETIHQAFTNLKDERVVLLLLRGDVRKNTGLRDIASHYFGLDRVPAVHWADVDIYVIPELRRHVAEVVNTGHYADVKAGEDLQNLPPEPAQGGPQEVWTKDMSKYKRAAFAEMSPMPVRSLTTFGLGLNEENGHKAISAHPDTRLWFDVSPGPHTIEMSYILAEGAYKNVGNDPASDGVRFSIIEVRKDGRRKQIFQRDLNPRDNPKDAGWQTTVVKAEISPGSEIEISTGPGPNGNYNRDWAGIGEIVIK